MDFINYYLKKLLFNLKQFILLVGLNYKYKAKIYSLKASTKAKYDYYVGIDSNTVIAPNVCIGYASYVNFDSWIENCSIGNYCSISDHVFICPAEHKIENLLSHPILGTKINKKVVIGNDVLISHNVTILSGAKIDDGSVIAAGAVVTKNAHIGEYEIWGGVPAKFIKKRFDEKTIKEIKKINLYKKTINQIKNEVWDKCEN